jgi:hypothetical protein
MLLFTRETFFLYSKGCLLCVEKKHRSRGHLLQQAQDVCASTSLTAPAHTLIYKLFQKK